MSCLRAKGSNLLLSINIEIKYPEIKYKLNKQEKSFEELRSFLVKAKSDYISQLNEYYKMNLLLRFLYGKIFRIIYRHFEFNYNIENRLRFILNNTNNSEKIIDGNISNNNLNYNLSQYKLMIENSFKNISDYLKTLFLNYNISLEKHYEKMLIKNKNTYKGIYFHKCENESMEEFVLKLYFDKLGQLPIAQNILICNKETSEEEIQAFLYRAILCEFNTLFTINIYDSFTHIQKNIMNNYINELLSYRREKMKTEKNMVEKEKTNTYLDSCIVFVCGNKQNDLEFLIKLGENINIEKENIENKYKENSFIKKAKVISSDVCGLGKTYKIKKKINKHKKVYYYFTINEEDSKNNIFVKLEKLLKKIKEDNGEKYEKVAIHLDMLEYGEISVINEFLFSFLITKFYCNKENIIFIPNEIEIYIEIPNSFENILSKYGILKFFERKNITLDKMPKLNLSEDEINIFKKILGYDNIDMIKQFIKNNIGMENYTYFQVRIFINIFISQFNMFSDRIKFVKDGLDLTHQYVSDITKTSIYFTSNGFTRIISEKKIDNIKKDLLYQSLYFDLQSKYNFPLIFINKETFQVTRISLNQERQFQNNKNEIYLNLDKIKQILNLPNDIDKDIDKYKSLTSILNYPEENYIITNDIFRKIALIYYRIQANIPVIIMGAPGFGKLSLVIKLNQFLNNGENNVHIINIFSEISEVNIIERIKQINEKVNLINKETWIYFNHINTCSSFSLIKEILFNRTFNGEKLNDKIRLIGSCYPYRIIRDNFYDNRNNNDKLLYTINYLPMSLLFFVFNFDLINQEDEKKIIFHNLNKLFTKEEKNLQKNTLEAIFNCRRYLRNIYDYSIVTIKDISRFLKLVQFFMKYYEIKEECLDKTDKKQNILLFKIKSIICSLYIYYYTKLINESDKNNFEYELKYVLLNLVNSSEENYMDDEFYNGNFLDKIKYMPLKEDLSNKEIYFFRDLLRIEQDFLLSKMELDESIWKNRLLKENIFLCFISLLTNIPLILIGQTGTSKSLSLELINKSMKGKYSKDKFFQKFPCVIITSLICSDSINPEDIENIFETTYSKYNYF